MVAIADIADGCFDHITAGGGINRFSKRAGAGNIHTGMKTGRTLAIRTGNIIAGLERPDKICLICVGVGPGRRCSCGCRGRRPVD